VAPRPHVAVPVIRLALRVPCEHADVVLAELLELAPAGVEEVQLPQAVEYAVYGAPGELPELPNLRAAVGGVPIEVLTTQVPDDWSERWKQFHHPVLIEPPRTDTHPSEAREGRCACAEGRARVPPLHVRPPWASPYGSEDVHEIVIDPGQAFGTGAHATTHMCLDLLLVVAALDPARGPVLDVGAGSGVLAIAAARLGYAPVLALDNDLESIRATAANAAVNGVELKAQRFDLRREPLPTPDGDTGPPAGCPSEPGGAPLVLANLLRPLLLSLASSMAEAPRDLIASGLLREEADEITAAFAERLSLRERERRERGEWAALWLSPA
jgi:ribosomal protein L11 methyltransferase